MYNGPDYNGGPIGNGESFGDFARISETISADETILTYNLSIYFFDLINDFLVFSEETELFDKQPDFSQPFSWTDVDFTDDNQKGSGTLRVRESFYPATGGFERNIDSTLSFTLASVNAVRVSSPSTWVMMIIFFGLFIRKLLVFR
ncbi:hypothetical protein [Alteromonas sp. Mac1]|uniref:hypothetical protein n=1 Tax=Alteromonas sp. Mac1 TaxID=1777491 RepID=UPI00076FE22E|nr:hypothetical protein [Alteromonas sp. Mac1]AMJ86436.1 hypothetical protein AV939_07470 [Alteromonas sp. Mac1]AMJ90295.1 hypothetical protein AV940_07300 [Alteromonas sp. Mac2]